MSWWNPFSRNKNKPLKWGELQHDRDIDAMVSSAMSPISGFISDDQLQALDDPWVYYCFGTKETTVYDMRGRYIPSSYSLAVYVRHRAKEAKMVGGGKEVPIDYNAITIHQQFVTVPVKKQRHLFW